MKTKGKIEKKIDKAKSRLSDLCKKIFLKKRKITVKGKLVVKARTTSGNWIKCKGTPIETDKIKVTRWGKFLGIFDYDEKYVEYENRKPTIYIDLQNSKPYDYRTARKYLPLKNEKGEVILETGVNPFQPKLQREFGYQFLTWKFFKPKVTTGLAVVAIMIIVILSIVQIAENERVRKEIDELKETVTAPPAMCLPCNQCTVFCQDYTALFSQTCSGAPLTQVPQVIPPEA